MSAVLKQVKQAEFMYIGAENLILTTEIGKLGYRFHCKDLISGVEYFSEWILQYPKFLLQKNLFFLSSKMAQHKSPAFLVDLETDKLLDANYKAKTILKILNLPQIKWPDLWADKNAYCKYKKRLLLKEQLKETIKFKTFEGEMIKLFTNNELHLIRPLNKSIVLIEAAICN